MSGVPAKPAEKENIVSQPIFKLLTEEDHVAFEQDDQLSVAYEDKEPAAQLFVDDVYVGSFEIFRDSEVADEIGDEFADYIPINYELMHLHKLKRRDFLIFNLVQ